MCKFYICSNEILENFARIRKTVGKKVKVCAVIKANAYGFGARKVVQLLNSQADYFAVARLTEYLQVKDELNKPCLILTPLNEKESAIAIKNGAEITISAGSSLEKINNVAAEANIKARVHIKLDTGMNRFGIKIPEELNRLLTKIKSLENIEIVGAFSHLYSAEDAETSTSQRERFLAYKKVFESHKCRPIYHFANSEGAKNPLNHFDMVRIGYDLYAGKEPSWHKLVTSVGEIKELSKGEIVSYGGKFRARKNMRIAICLAGYADGVKRQLSSRGKVLINGQEAAILGNVCMDCFMADITGIEGAKVGDEVVIFGKSQEKYVSVCDVAKLCDTIPYEIYTSISQRVKRVYFWRKNASNCRQISGEKASKP